MTWDPQRQAFICGRSRKRCLGSGKPVVVKKIATSAGPTPRVEYSVCGRVNVATYETGDGRILVVGH